MKTFKYQSKYMDMAVGMIYKISSVYSIQKLRNKRLFPNLTYHSSMFKQFDDEAASFCHC